MFMSRWQSGYAQVCKTCLRRFESGLGLHTPQEKNMTPETFARAMAVLDALKDAILDAARTVEGCRDQDARDKARQIP